MSNRTLKLQLYAKNPFCHYCGKKMILTNDSNLNGAPHPLTCTVEHLVSRFSIYRWVKKKPGQRRRVLACYKCNQGRNIQETLCLSRAEILKRSQGFSLSPRGKPKIIKPVSTVHEAMKKLNSPSK